jgi:hypothetical protein
LVCDTALALTTAATALPEFSVALVAVNSNIYGGSGGSVSVSSLAPGATEIAMHEIGHSLFHLADEYPYYADWLNPEPDRAHHPPIEPLEANVTVNGNPATLKWKDVLTAGVPLPTMSNPDCATLDHRPSPFPADTVGLFEGAHYFRCGVFRAGYDCKMRTIGLPFCRVCREAIVRQLTPLLPPT